MKPHGSIILVGCCLALGAADLGVINLALVPAMLDGAGSGETSTAAREQPPTAEQPPDAPAPIVTRREEAAPAEPPAAPPPGDVAPRGLAEVAAGASQDVAVAVAETEVAVAPPEPEPEPTPEPRAEPPSDPTPEPTPRPTATETGVGEGTRSDDARLQASFTLHFAADSFELDSSAMQRIATIAQTLRARTRARVLIEGHTDARGSVAHNRDLSWRRATAVGAELERLGISRSRLVLRARGERQPIDPGMHEAAYARNRRAEVLVGSRR